MQWDLWIARYQICKIEEAIKMKDKILEKFTLDELKNKVKKFMEENNG